MIKYPAESFTEKEIRRPLPTVREIAAARRHQKRKAFKAWVLRRERLSQSPHTRANYPAFMDLPRRQRAERMHGGQRKRR